MKSKEKGQTPKRSKILSFPPLLSLTAVALDAVIITVAALVSDPESVMYFGAFLLVGNLMGHRLYLRLPRRSLRAVFPTGSQTPAGLIKHLLADHRSSMSTVYRHLHHARLWAALSRLNYPLLAVAVALSSPITATLLYSFRSIMLSIGFNRILERRKADYKQSSSLATMPQGHITILRWLLIVLAVIGAALIILATGSDGDGGQSGLAPDRDSGISWTYLAGIVAGLATTVITALILFANRWADRTHTFTADMVTAKQHAALKKSWLAIYLESQALWIAILPVAVLTLVLDFSGVIPTASPRVIVFALLAGLLLRTPTQICLRTAYAASTDATLPAIESSLPLVSFVVLGSLGLANVTNWGLMITGLIAITVGLVLLQAKVDWHKIHTHHHQY